MKRFITPLLFLIICSMPLSQLMGAETPTTSSVLEDKRSEPKAVNPFDEVIEKQAESSDNRFVGEFIKMLVTLGMVIAALLFISWFMKRFLNTRIQQMNADSVIKIVERRSISPKTSIYLLDIGGKQITVAESQNGVTLLEKSPERLEDVRRPFPPT